MTTRTAARTGPGRERLVEAPAADIVNARATARTLAEVSISPNTAAAYRSALTRVDGWHGDRPISDTSLAAYLREIYDSGRSPATASVAIAAVAFRARPAGQPNSIGEQTRRIEAAGRAAGVDARLTGHSGRVGLASELTARGASTADVMLAGGWKTARMVSHYAAGATAENGAVKRYL